MRSGLKLVGMIGKTMIATLGENHAEGFSIHVNYCNKESLHRPLQLTMPLRITLSVSFSKGLRETTLSKYTKLYAGYCPTIMH